MQIEINGEAERMVQQVMDSGRFDSPGEVVEAAMTALPDFNLPGRPLARARLEAMIRLQGVKPLKDGTELHADFWPEDETADDINAFVRELRCAARG
ncbi:MAG: hypothetical protein DWQ34_10270 [Planctomycetota bacterium]|nr:MAG: hypothetical protein DWQ29_15145 [Planctomycetota bacterium]REJ93606.1 MAG: hypothetical protein DWQ34_10270 [Planctomycetota bacterium]REK19934.1 MAG: hypothetical protein DWQ41_26770 [Planctomycetota bacterium]REK27499.1 MAG: hypothetical protein DWQ45_25785 [Planctomycetota bacterium]